MLESIRNFGLDKYTKFCSEVNHLRLKLEDEEDLTVEEMASLEEMVKDILSNPILQIENVGVMQEDKLLGKFIHHDVSNMMTLVIINMELLSGKSSTALCKVRALKIILDKLAIYSLILEDILLRKVNIKKLPEHSREFEVEYLWEGLKSLKNNQIAVERRLHKMFELPGNFPSLQPGEKIVGNPGVIANGLFNVIRNGCAKEVDSTRVVLDAVIERGKNSELVLRVKDNGIGIPPEFLDEKDLKYIFRMGTSHRGSTGQGLADMPERLKQSGADLSVSSSPRVGDSEAWSTIFEIRLPIIKE